MNNLRVVSLRASNILRLSAVEIQWEKDKAVLTLGGKNGAGKSSVLNAVAMALGGLALCPDEPLKRGEERGFVELNLGELIVRREFWRHMIKECIPFGSTPEEIVAHVHTAACEKSWKWSDTESRLVVKNPEGIKQEPAQRLLDRLIGKLTFDPTAFAFEEGKKQDAILRQIVGLDVSAFDDAHKTAYERRAHFNKEYKTQLTLLDAMTHYENVPDAEVSLSGLSAELTTADELRKKAVEADKWLGTATQSHKEAVSNLLAAENDYARCEAEILHAQARRDAALKLKIDREAVVKTAAIGMNKAVDTLKTANDAVPDTSAIQTRIKETEDLNNKIRANKARKNVMSAVVSLQELAQAEEDKLNAALDAKATALRAVVFPVPGLGLSDDGVTFNTLPFKQASTSEQIRVSVAIGFALNPGLKLLCVRNGNALDDDSLALVVAAAEQAGGQVLMEVVTKDANDVSVFIEDGHNV